MRTECDPDGSLVTTPIYVGTSQDLIKASVCSHDFKDSGKPEKLGPEEQEGVLQRCERCCATRFKFTKK